MKRYLLLVVVAVFAHAAAYSQYSGIYGSWRIDNIVYTFTKDSLYIDDDSEGFAYLFHRDLDNIYRVTYDSNVNGVTGEFHILYMDGVKMVANFVYEDKSEEKVILFREHDYNFRLHFSKEANNSTAYNDKKK